MLDKTKIFLECLAIVLGGGFVLVTWGFDQVQKREASWEVGISTDGGYRLEEKETSSYLRQCLDSTKCNTIACKYPATVTLENKGKRPIDILDTKVEIFFLPKQREKKGVIKLREDISPYTLYIEACAPDKKGVCSKKPDYSLTLKPLDTSPLFPDVKARRPFSFILDKGKEAENYFTSNGMLILATQTIESKHPIWFWNTTQDTSVALLYDHEVCGYGIELKPIQ